MKLCEILKLSKRKIPRNIPKFFRKILSRNQLFVHIYWIRYKKIDLFRIFDNFTLDGEYPFIQYQPTDGTPRYQL